MMPPLDDHEIRAMLEARADRVGEAAAHEIRSAVKARIVGRGVEVRGQGLEVSVRPVSLDRPAMRGTAWLGAGLAAALVIALGGLLLQGALVAPVASPSPGGSVARPSAATSPAGASLAVAPTAAALDAFRVDLLTSRVNGRIVLLTGTLKVTPIRCREPGPACDQITVVGLDGVGVRYWSTTAFAADVRAAIEAHPGPSLMAFRVDVTDLVLLGWPLQPPEAPLVVRQLEGPATGIGGDDLAIVNAWLVGGSGTAECPATIPAQPYCPGAEPYLTDDPPGTDGRPRLPNEIVAVGVDPSLGLGQWPAQTVGLFLVRYRAVRGWASPFEVIAHLDPASTIRVETSRLDLSPSGPLTAAQLRAALEDGSLVDRLIVVDGTLRVAAWPCPTPGGAVCLTLFLDGLDGVSIIDDMPLASVSAGPAPIRTRLLFRGGLGSLRYLGRDVDNRAPVAVASLLGGSNTTGPDALSIVSGWLVVGGIHSCPIQLEGETPCPGPPPWLTDDRPFENGMLATNEGVAVALSGWMSQATAGHVVTQGPFLVRRAQGMATCGADGGIDCAAAGWEIVSGFDAGSLVEAQLP